MRTPSEPLSIGTPEARRAPNGDVALHVGAVVLAAGASTRMGAGANKLLLDVDGVPMVRRTVRRVAGSGVVRVVVVLGHEAARVRDALKGIPCTFAENPDFTGPTSGSLHAGLRALDADEVGDGGTHHSHLAGAFAPATAGRVGAALVMLGDMVNVTETMLRTVVDAARESNAPLVVSRYGDEHVLAPPLLFRRPLWPELLAWQGEGCGKAVVMAHRREALMVDWPASALKDVDTPADYESLTP